MRSSDITGQRFGRLTVAALAGHDRRNRRAKWDCNCDCGGKIITFAKYLQRGTRVDCGCGDKARHQLNGEKRKKPESGLNHLLNDYLGNARRRGYAFSLSKEEFFSLCVSHCHYCGCAPSRPLSSTPWILVNGVDRVDNSRGYEVDNAVSCCTICNYLKREMDYAQFLTHIRRIAAHVPAGVELDRPNTPLNVKS